MRLVALATSLDAMLHPLVFCVLLITGISLCLCLFLSVKAGMRSLEQWHHAERSRIDALEKDLRDARASILRLGNDLQEVQAQSGMLVPPAPAKSGLNLTKRTQVLRLYRAGNDEGHIAANLRLPRAEVALLIKIHQIALEQI